jgi:hypothetical protein
MEVFEAVWEGGDTRLRRALGRHDWMMLTSKHEAVQLPLTLCRAHGAYPTSRCGSSFFGSSGITHNVLKRF